MNIETKVGIFLMAGIAVVCTLILFFGEVQDIFKPTYELTVTFPDASGLLKGSEVYLSGAEVGKVITDPEAIPDTQLVQVKLKINNKVQIREHSTYDIGSSGLLGDRFVEIKPKEYPKGTPEEAKDKYVKDQDHIDGSSEPGLQDLSNAAEPLIKKANDIAQQLDEMIRKLNTDVLSGTSTQDLKDTIADLRSMVKNGNELLGHANQSQGALGMIINDKQSADDLKQTIRNLRDLSANLKEHGVLFYSNDSKDKADDKGAKTKDGKRH